MRIKYLALPLLLTAGACVEPATAPKQETAAKAQAMYEEGLAKFKEGDYDSSFALWMQAAEEGSADAAAKVARSYNYGQGTDVDYVKSAEWYEKAAQMGNAEAMYEIGECYSKGKGVPKDDVKAFQWMQKAAEKNYPDAVYMLGVMYTMGRGTEPQRELGMELIRKAAELGQESAIRTVELYDMLPQLTNRQQAAPEQSPSDMSDR
jgi:TPR repeat protein